MQIRETLIPYFVAVEELYRYTKIFSESYLKAEQRQRTSNGGPTTRRDREREREKKKKKKQ